MGLRIGTEGKCRHWCCFNRYAILFRVRFHYSTLMVVGVERWSCGVPGKCSIRGIDTGKAPKTKDPWPIEIHQVEI